MKRIKFIIFVFSVSLIFNACQKSLNEYMPKNDTEKDIIALLNTFVDARNNGDMNRLASTFHDSGMLIAANGVTLTKKKIAESKPDWFLQYGTLELLSPEFKINGNEATVSMTGRFGGVTKQSFICKLIKENGKWLIMELVT